MPLTADQKKALLDALEGDTAVTDAAAQGWMADQLKKSGKLPVKNETPGSDDESNESNNRSVGMPRLSTFVGGSCGKHDTSYRQWRFEIDCLQKEKIYSEPRLRYQIRRSLKGEAGTVAERLGPDASLSALIEELDLNYGSSDNAEDCLAEFNTASQNVSESVVSWAIRLESMYSEIVRKKLATDKERDSQLRLRFWQGLQSQMREGAWHHFDSTTTFADLRKRMRLFENRKNRDTPVKGQLKMAAAVPNSDEDSTFKQILAEMKAMKASNQKLVAKVDGFERELSKRKESVSATTQAAPPSTIPPQQQFGQWSANQGMVQPQPWQMPNQPRPMQQNRPGFHQIGNQMPSQPTHGASQQVPGGPRFATPQPPQQSDSQARDARVCFHCNMPGHIRRDCPYKRQVYCYKCGGVGHIQTACNYLN